MTWLIIIIVVAAIGGIWGYFSADDGERGEGAATGALAGAWGCGTIIFHILLTCLSLYLVFRLASWLFG